MGSINEIAVYLGDQIHSPWSKEMCKECGRGVKVHTYRELYLGCLDMGKEKNQITRKQQSRKSTAIEASLDAEFKKSKRTKGKRKLWTWSD